MNLKMPPPNLPPRAPPQTTSHGPTLACAHRFVASSSEGVRPGISRETTSRFLPPLLSSQPFSRSLDMQPCLFQMKLATYLLGHPSWHLLDPGLCPQCEEEIETAEHALLRCPCPVRQYALESFPETLKSAWHDATATETLANFVCRTLMLILRDSPPLKTMAPLPHPLLPHSPFAWVRRFFVKFMLSSGPSSSLF